MSARKQPPVNSAYELVRELWKLQPETRVNYGAKMVEKYVQQRLAVAKTCWDKAKKTRKRPTQKTK